MPRALLSVGLALCAAASVLAQTYTITSINPPAGVSSSSVESVNNVGQVVGTTSIKSGRSNVAGPAFVWSAGVALSLPSLPGDSTAGARAISDSGVIVGYSPSGAVWWQNTGGGYVVRNWNAFLPSDSTAQLYGATAITPDSQFVVFDAVDRVTGYDQAVVAEVAFTGATPSGFTRLWLIGSLDGSVTDDGFVSAGTDISSDGNGMLSVVGYASYRSAGTAFLWKKDLVSEAVPVQMINLDPMRIHISQANGVNGPGEVVGNIGYTGSQAFFWNTVGARQQLPTLGGARSYGNSINDAGLVVGTSQRSGKNVNNHAFIWGVGLGMVDLNTRKAASDTSGLELTDARKINNAGQILAYGVKKTSGANVLLTPVR